MGKWLHRLTEIDQENETATCGHHKIDSGCDTGELPEASCNLVA